MSVLLALLLSWQTASVAAISGRVVLADSRAPAAGLSILCTTRDGADSWRTQTDQDGRFHLPLAAGIYLLEAETGRTHRHYLPHAFGAHRLRAGDHLRLEASLLTAASLSGRVLDGDGSPLPGAVVRAHGEVDEDGSLPLFKGDFEGQTAADGRFTLSPLAPGTYRLQVAGSTRVPLDRDGAAVVKSFYPGVTDERLSTTVRLAAGEHLDLQDFTAVRAKLPLVAGVMLFPDSSPAAAVNFALFSLDSTGLPTIHARTDQHGSFRVPSVAPGYYDLVVRRDTERFRASVVVEGPDITDLTLILQPAAGIAGRVRFDGNRPQVTALRVYTDLQLDPTTMMGLVADTDSNDTFELRDARGPALFRVKDLPKGWWLKRVSVAGRDITNERVDVTSGLQGVEMLLSRSMSRITGVIETRQAELPPDLVVVAFSEDEHQWVRETTAAGHAWPDETGRFTIEGLPEGRYHVAAVPRLPLRFGHQPRALLKSLALNAQVVTLENGRQASVVLTIPE